VQEIGGLIGRVFAGRYRVEELIGRGGMGHVFRAVHTTMNKVVALKIMSSEMAVNPENVQRFEREAAAASELRHPNTIHMFDFGTSDRGELYLAMEFLEGRTLARCLTEDGPFSPARAGRIFRQLMESLEEAHAKGIIHRDLKPENVFITETHRVEDFVKVLDFGIAKFKRTDQIKQTLTRTGFVCGTPQYLAPEQGLGTPVSHETDLYSAGVVLYEMLSGTAPFTGDDPVSMVMKHIHEAPPSLPPEVRANLPDPLADLLRRLLEKDPRRRPSSAARVIAQLDALGELSVEAPPGPELEHTAPDAGPTLVGRPTPALDPQPRRSVRRFRAAVALVALAAALAAFGIWRPWEGGVPPPESPGPEPAPRAPAPEAAISAPASPATPDVIDEIITAPDDAAAESMAGVAPEVLDSRTSLALPAQPDFDVPHAEGESGLKAVFDPPMGDHTLRITTTPVGASVTVDGGFLGTTPIGLVVGDGVEPVRVQVALDGHRPQEWVFVPADVQGRVAEKEFVLEPVMMEAPPAVERPRAGDSPFGDLW